MEENYPDPISKISLTIAVGQQAKSAIVAEEGIGEELAMNVLGWRDGKLACVAQMDTSWDSDEDERVSRTGDAYIIMRRGWLCDSFTILAEGYVSRNPDKTRSSKLSEAYLDPDKGVNECLTVTYVDVDHTELCAIPLKVAYGRKVEWGPMMHTYDIDVLRNSQYVMNAQNILEQEVNPIPEDAETFHLALAVGLHDSAGYFIQYDL